MEIVIQNKKYLITDIILVDNKAKDLMRFNVFDENYKFIKSFVCESKEEFIKIFENFINNKNTFCNMKWCEAYIQMKENNAFVRRKVWGKNYIIWLKPVFLIQEDWCKDENLKKIISNFGGLNGEGKKIIKGKESISLFDGFGVESGWEPRPEDKIANDWEVVTLK